MGKKDPANKPKIMANIGTVFVKRLFFDILGHIFSLRLIAQNNKTSIKARHKTTTSKVFKD
jgi:hypothetical protein